MAYFDNILIFTPSIQQHSNIYKLFDYFKEEIFIHQLEKVLFYIGTSDVLGVQSLIARDSNYQSKVKAIVDWPIPTNINQVGSFHGLASLYRCFIKKFSSLMAPITNCMKKVLFKWTTEAENSFSIRS